MKYVSFCLALAAAALGAGCAVNPATGQRQIALVSESQEVALGRQAAQEIKESIGVYDAPALQRYVDGVGQALAAKSERPDLPWEFVVVDDPTVNAFALPGGHIFVTRGILAHFNSEAELAAVLGHEIGHVTGRHSVEQMSKAQLAQLGLGLGSVLSPNLRALQGVIGQGVGLLFLKHGRDDEREADRLGVRYMVRGEYAPTAALDVFTMLDRQTRAAGGQRLPDWLSTHPAPADRRAGLQELIAALPEGRSAGREAREPYLAALDGVLYGTDPREGFVRQDRFVHPVLGFSLRVPQGWQVQNGRDAVDIVAPKGAAGLRLTLAAAPTVEAAAERFYGQGGVQGSDVGTTTVNGLPAAVGRFSAQTSQGGVAGVAAHIAHGQRVYELLGMSGTSTVATFAPEFERIIRSFTALAPGSADAPAPHRVRIVPLARATTIAELRQSRPSPVSAEQLALLNGVGVGDRLEAGRRIKWVE